MSLKVLIISYFSKKGPVGTMRIRYWVDYLKEKEIPVEVWTADDVKEDGFVYISDTKKNLLSYIIKDRGASWKRSIKKYLSENEIDDFTHILFTGGPFIHFSLANVLKKKTKAKVIFDYRDSFTTNPRFQNSKLKILIKRFFEQRFNKKADYIVGVNHFMSQLIETKQKVHIIPNGFDERYFTSFENIQRTPSVFEAIYAGSLYSNPKTFLSSVEKRSDITCSIYGSVHPDEEYENVHYFSPIPYNEMIKKLIAADIGLIFTQGHPFESTTKIYDYIGAQLKILIITEGSTFTGSLHDITKNYPNTVWSKNNSKDIDAAIDKIIAMKIQQVDVSPYSRAHSANLLLQLIKNETT